MGSWTRLLDKHYPVHKIVHCQINCVFSLLSESLISFVQACSSEVMMFRMSRKYDAQSDSILFVNNQPYSRDSYNLAGLGETIEDLLHFCRTMYSMKVDNAEYALLTAIVIFSGSYLYNVY